MEAIFEETMCKAQFILDGDQWIAIAGIVTALITVVVNAVVARERSELKKARVRVSKTEKTLLTAILAIEGYQDYLEGVATEKGCRDYSQLFHDTIKQGREENFKNTIFLQKAELRNRRTHLLNNIE